MDHDLRSRAKAVDLLKRVFGPQTVELDGVYVSDITYIWTWGGDSTWPP